jgi:putative endonuclease
VGHRQDRVDQLSTRQVGRLAEQIAMEFLRRRGVRIISANRRVGQGEVDLIVAVSGERAVVEVRSVRSEAGPVNPDPVDAFDVAKSVQVRRLAARLRIRRVDLVAVRFTPDGVDIRWVPRAA